MAPEVLIVEDDQTISGDLAFLLQSEGYRVLQAENGYQALKLLRARNTNPSLLLLDIMMPEMDGWQFRAEQLKDESLAKIPVVVMTADGDARQKANRMNARGWVQKPFDIDHLLRVIADSLRTP